MGLWSKIKKGVKKVAKKVKDVVSDAGDAVGKAFETAGAAINDGLNWVGKKVGAQGPFNWLGNVLKGAFSLVGAVVKGTFDILGGGLGGAIMILGGLFTGQWALMLEGLMDIVSSVVGSVIIIGGKALALVQVVTFLQDFERPLTEKERKIVKRVFKDSLQVYIVRIVPGRAGLFSLNSRPFTLGNTIYLKNNPLLDSLLVHECTHAWQYQNFGSEYSSDAVAAQLFVPDEYSWEREINVRRKTDWFEFNKEAQASFLEDLWDEGELMDSSGTVTIDGNGGFYDADWRKRLGRFELNSNDYTEIGKETVKAVRVETPWW